nr:hypothetical protein CACDSRKY_CACDSRKY_CDS_0046 [Caudoviricetes sp.]
MSEYNKTILTNAGIDLARRANKGAATFQLTRGVSSTENLSEKTIEELQNLTQLPSIQQSVSLSDVVDTTDNPDTVLGIRMTFDNQNLNTGYNVHTVGVYAKEPGKGEILYGVATAKTPEYIPDFREQMLFKFDFLMYLVIGRTDKVTVQVSPDDVYLKKDTYNKAEIDAKVSDAVSKLNDKDAEILKNLNDYKQENKTYHQNLEQQLDTKADKSAVNQQLETKADKSTTYTKDEVNSKIAGQVKSVNGHTADSNGEVTLPKLKAKTLISYDVPNKTPTYDGNAAFGDNGYFSRWPVDRLVIDQLADAINAKLPIEAGAADDDLCHLTSSKISFWNGNGENVKNLPPMSNKQRFFAIRLVGPGGWGSVTVVDQDGTYWLNTKNGDIWAGWRSVTTNETLKKLKFVKQSVNQNGETFQDTKFVTQETDGTFKINIYDSDWTASKVSWLLKNTQSYNISANTDLNDIKAPGLYHCSGASNIANVPDGRDSWFNMVVNSDNWNGSQAFYATNHNQLYIRTWNSTAFTAWRRVINDSDYNNLLPLSGGNMVKGSWITWNGSGANESKDGNIGGIQWTGATDNIKIFGDNNSSDNLDLAIQLGDDNSNHVSFRRANGDEVAAINLDGRYTGTIDWNHVNGRPDINNANPVVTVINSFDVANVKEGPHQTWPVKQPSLVDQMALHPFAEAINSLKGQGSYRIDYAVDVNTLTGIPNQVTVYILTNGNNRGIPIALTNPNMSDARGTLIVFNYDGNAKTQIWMPVGVSGQMGFAWRYWEGQYAPAWHTYYDTITSLGSATDSLRKDMTKFQQRVDPNTPKGSFNNQTVNINDLRETGIYRFANCHIQNGPYTNDYAHWIYLKVTVFDANTVYQTLYEGDNMYGRKSSSPSDWGRWRRYLNEVI